MRYSLTCALVCLLSLRTGCGIALAEEATVRVMLQGHSTEQLAKLVTRHGGTVTHRLHIINAVGVLVPPSRLQSILASSLVTRHIDDLWLDAPGDQNSEDCLAGGALEIQQQGDSLFWNIFNKGSRTLELQELELEWPKRLGELLTVKLGERELSTRRLRPRKGEILKLHPEDESPFLIQDSARLALTFSHGATSTPHLRQRELHLVARFKGDCMADLIPGYTNYGADTYYPTVAGAAALHKHGITGRGVTVAVLDSGLWEHEALSRDTRGRYRVVGHYDAISDREHDAVFDESGHGTHMASVIANSSPVTRQGALDGSYMGIAPDVDLVIVKAFNSTGQGDFLDIVRGIQWIVEQRERLGIRVLNLSFSARPRWPYWLDPINQAVMRAWQAGIVVVAAAGNDGPEPMTIGSPGNLPYLITVGAITDSWTPQDRDDDYLPDFSSRGPTPSAHIKPDIVAPGGHIAGLTRPGSTLMLEHPDYELSSGEFAMTGTSQASALVSGIAALLLQLEPELSPDDVKCKLVSSAEPAINRDGRLAYSPFEQGNGLVSASRAVTLGERGCANSDMDIEKDIANEQHYEGPATIANDGSTSLPGLAELYSGEPSPKGPSDNRRWGVKDHIERSESPVSDRDSPINWLQQYLREKQIIEQLANSSSD